MVFGKKTKSDRGKRAIAITLIAQGQEYGDLVYFWCSFVKAPDSLAIGNCKLIVKTTGHQILLSQCLRQGANFL
jgi:hypothetical protein